MCDDISNAVECNDTRIVKDNLNGFYILSDKSTSATTQKKDYNWIV